MISLQRICFWSVLLLFVTTQNTIAQIDGAATVEVNGTVTDGSTGQPVARALVELTGFGVEPQSQPPAPPKNLKTSVFTGNSGSFHFSGLPAGTFSINVSRPMFQEAAQVVQTTPGVNIVSLKLTRLSVLSGKVVGVEEDPLQGVNLILYKTSIVQGRRILTLSRNVVTDDLGNYRLWNLSPAIYVLKAAGRGKGTALYSSEMLPSFSAAETFNPVYFGGSGDWRTATPLDLRSASEASADFRLSLQPARKIRGVVTGAALFRNAAFELYDRNDNLVSSRAVLSGVAGAFQLLDVLPGTYVIRVRQGDGDSQVFGEAAVTVGDADLDGVTVPLRGPVTVKLLPECVVNQESNFGTACVRLILFGREGTPLSRPGRAVRYPPGEYSFQATAPGSYVKDVLVGGQLIRPGERLRISEGMGPVEIQSSQDAATLDVKLDLTGQAKFPDVGLLAVPVSENYSGAVPIFAGAGILMKFAPGDYQIYALLSAEMQQLEYHNADALRGLIPAASVKLEPGGHHTVTVRNLSR